MATPPKKPTTRRTGAAKAAGTRKTAVSSAGDAAGATAAKATGTAGAVKAAATGKTGGGRSRTTAAKSDTTGSRAKTARKPAAGTAGQVKAAVKSAPHNVAEKAGATARRAKEKSPIGIKTAIAAGLGAVGAVATAALLTLRGSTPKEQAKLPAPGDANSETHTATQADGTDSSKSFEAGIADEGTIPRH